MRKLVCILDGSAWQAYGAKAGGSLAVIRWWFNEVKSCQKGTRHLPVLSMIHTKPVPCRILSYVGCQRPNGVLKVMVLSQFQQEMRAETSI